MKKPNITEGEWEFVHDESLDEGGLLRFVFYSEHKSCPGFGFVSTRNFEDALAVSAVPDMIDVLIGCKLRLESTEKESDLLTDHLYDGINSALKKAGVEL